jgi:G3E family GTPase
MTSERFPRGEAMASDPAAASQTLSMLMGIFEAARIVPLAAPKVTMPLTIVSGFLGAGKTTFVNRLLSDPGGRRIAVLVNDFAAVNIDEELIRFQSGDTIGLTNGCACCSINGDLVKAIQRLVERDDPPDVVVLEASGIADPRGIAQIALANPAVTLDAIVTLVDAETFADRLHDERTRGTLLAQLSAADLVLINKTDLVASDLAGTRSLVRSVAPSAVLLDAVHGDVPTDVVLGAVNRGASPFFCAPIDHAAGFSSLSRAWADPVDRTAVLRALRNLPPYVVRAKATLRFADDVDHSYVYQRIGQREALERSGDAAVPGDSRLVLIGFSDQWDADELSRLFP